MSSIFTKIIQGEIPCYKVYEDDLVFAFLDIRPMQLGHTLLVPRAEVDQIQDLDEAVYVHLFQIAKKLSGAIQKATGHDRVGMLVEGLEVPHAHLHLVPISHPGELSFSRSHEETEDAMKKIQKTIQENI